MLNGMLDDGLLMLVIMNPFAQMLYLSHLMEQTDTREFGAIYLQGTFLTLLICIVVALLGEPLIFGLFQVTLPAMRVFGGLINLQLSYSYVMKGPEGVKLFRGDANELAQQIALPIMVGAGVVWISLRIGQKHSPLPAVLIIAAVLAVNFVLVLGYQAALSRSRGRLRLMLLKYFGVAMRFNALLIGAVSIDMILDGIRESWMAPPS